LLPAEAVGEIAEEQRADDRTGDVDGAGQAELRRRQAERLRALQLRRHRADDRDLEAVQDPYRTERDDDQPVPPRPGQPVDPGRDVGFDNVLVLLPLAMRAPRSKRAHVSLQSMKTSTAWRHVPA